MSKKLQKYIKNQSEILKGVSSYIFKELTSINIECTKSEGAFYMMIGFNNYKTPLEKISINTSEQLAIYLLEKYNVALLPASDFYFKENELFFRLAFVDFNGKKVLKAFKKEGEITDEFIKTYCRNIYDGVKRLENFVKSL